VRNYFGQQGDDIPGDTNGDGVIDIDDLNRVRNGFGAAAATSPLGAREASATPAGPDIQSVRRSESAAARPHANLAIHRLRRTASEIAATFRLPDDDSLEAWDAVLESM
jgi:hypothetical protein